MTLKTKKRVVLVTALFVILTILLTFTASASGNITFDSPPREYDGYRHCPIGKNGSYSASINQHIEYYGAEAIVRFEVTRADPTIEEWGYSVCYSGWKCTNYTTTGDLIDIPLGELCETMPGFENADEGVFVFLFGDNVAMGRFKIVYPLDYSHIGKTEPFTSFLTDLPKGLINGFNGFAKHPSGMYKAEFVTALFYVVVLIAIAVCTFVLNLTFTNNNIFRRRK